MMTLEQVKEKLQDRNIAEVSRRCNLQYQTVFNIATGRNKNPSYNTVVKLVEYFKGGWNVGYQSKYFWGVDAVNLIEQLGGFYDPLPPLR